MKSISTLFVLSGILMFGCSTLAEEKQSSENGDEVWSEVDRDENFPYSEIEAVYETILEAMTLDYFKEFSELDEEHTQAMTRFIQHESPKDEFVEMMVRDEAVEIFRKAKGNREYWDTKEFKDAYSVAINVSVPMAQLIVGNARDLYVAKFVEKDSVRLELFEMATSEEQKQLIAWVYGEVSEKEYREDQFAPDYEFKEGDRIFGYSGGNWEMLSGREGYIIVRDGKIFDSFITIMN